MQAKFFAAGVIIRLDFIQAWKSIASVGSIQKTPAQMGKILTALQGGSGSSHLRSRWLLRGVQADGWASALLSRRCRTDAVGISAQYTGMSADQKQVLVPLSEATNSTPMADHFCPRHRPRPLRRSHRFCH